MAALSRILNVLVILVAIGALVIGIKLASHREHARNRGDAYAKTITDTAKALDENSGTGVSGKLTQLDWKSWETDPSGTEASARKVVDVAGQIVAQRDGLADSIASIGEAVGVTVDDLKTVEGYAEKVGVRSDALQKFQRRCLSGISDEYRRLPLGTERLFMQAGSGKIHLFELGLVPVFHSDTVTFFDSC
jgi:hypothetical protein